MLCCLLKHYHGLIHLVLKYGQLILRVIIYLKYVIAPVYIGYILRDLRNVITSFTIVYGRNQHHRQYDKCDTAYLYYQVFLKVPVIFHYNTVPAYIYAVSAEEFLIYGSVPVIYYGHKLPRTYVRIPVSHQTADTANPAVIVRHVCLIHPDVHIYKNQNAYNRHQDHSCYLSFMI